MPDVLQLVCEGSCNPHLKRWDDLSAHNCDPRAATGLTLIHTPHFFIKRTSDVDVDTREIMRFSIYACEVCGRWRRWGLDESGLYHREAA